MKTRTMTAITTLYSYSYPIPLSIPMLPILNPRIKLPMLVSDLGPASVCRSHKLVIGGGGAPW
jgi:hypothetical protein